MFYQLDEARTNPARFQAVIDKVRASNSQPQPTQEQSDAYGHEEIDIDGFPLHLLQTGTRDKVILFLHGGAYILGLNQQYWELIVDIGQQSNHHVAVFDYPIAPEHTCETAVSRTLQTYQHLLQTYTPSDITIMGDSAGGGLAAALCQHLHQHNLPQPASLVLLYPWLDVTMSNPQSRKLERKDLILACDGLAACGVAYAGEREPTDPLVSPLFGTVEGLSKTAVFIGTNDILHPQAIAFHQKLTSAGMPSELFEYRGLPHAWLMFPTPERERAIAEIAQFL
ncbi:MAG: alpha/beta hydrolase [Chloroflexota bacterium]